MIQKKVCMLGAFAVGKTSLVSRFVHSYFSDRYLSTLGVKIEKRVLDVRGTEVSCIVWDVYGEDAVQKVPTSYLRGVSGYILVVDGTRRATLDTAFALQALAAQVTDGAPFVLVLNKKDLVEEWEIDPDRIEALRADGWTILEGSAKTGEGVEEAFLTLAERMVAQ